MCDADHFHDAFEVHIYSKCPLLRGMKIIIMLNSFIMYACM